MSSPNHAPRPAGLPVDMLVLHYTGMQSARAALARLCDPAAEVSSHYLIAEDGLVWQLVGEDRCAWHAGVSSWRGATDINARSIGIELANPGHDHGSPPFPALQMAALAELCEGILARHPIPARNVVGHSDIAPERKRDPGEMFEWDRLAELGIGLWPHGVPGDDTRPAEIPADLLTSIGYGRWSSAATIAAAQRRWRPSCVSGSGDVGTLLRLRAVAAMIG